MYTNKVYTAKNTGNSVRFLIVLFSVFQILSGCNLLDQPDTADVIDNITGTWKCAETSSSFGDQNYDVTISRTSEMSVSIKNFLGLLEVYAEVEGYNLTIPTQTVGGFEISGSGTVMNGYKKISWSYTTTDESGTDSFTAVYTPY